MENNNKNLLFENVWNNQTKKRTIGGVPVKDFIQKGLFGMDSNFETRTDVFFLYAKRNNEKLSTF